MRHPAAVLMEIANTSGKLAKRQILKDNEFNEELKMVLQATYDRRFNWYITKIPKNLGPTKALNTLSYAVSVLMDQLSTRKISGVKAKAALVKDLFMTLSEADQQCLEWIIKRDVKAGIKEKSILEVWPDLFPYYPYMRCSVGKKPNDIHYSELKADGVFSRWFNSDKLAGRTRNGTPLVNIPEYVTKDFRNILCGVYEGEMLIEQDGKVLPREIGNGIVNACFLHGTRQLEDNQKLRVQLWEVIPEKAYWKGIYDVPRTLRLHDLEAILTTQELDSLYLVPYKICYSQKESTEHYQSIIAKGLEGTIDKNFDGIYKDGTSKDQIKRKIEETVELRAKKLLPAAEGSKNEHLFGSMLCESECGKVQVAATGFTDKLRKEIFDNWDYYQDKVTGIKSNGVTPPSKTNPLYSLYLPRYDGWRDMEKSSADTLEYILEVFENG